MGKKEAMVVKETIRMLKARAARMGTKEKVIVARMETKVRAARMGTQEMEMITMKTPEKTMIQAPRMTGIKDPMTMSSNTEPTQLLLGS